MNNKPGLRFADFDLIKESELTEIGNELSRAVYGYAGEVDNILLRGMLVDGVVTLISSGVNPNKSVLTLIQSLRKLR